MATILTNKELKDNELVKQHKELLDTFMKNELEWNSYRRKKMLKIYDNHITERNIRFYFCRPLRLFVTALITKQLDKIANYFPKDYSFNPEIIGLGK